MRTLPLLLLVLATPFVPGTAHAACSGVDENAQNGGNAVWLSSWRCDGEPDERSDTARVDVFFPFSTSQSMTLVTVTSSSKVDHGAFGSYTRHDVLVLHVAGRESSARMTTSEDTQGRTSCQLSLRILGIGAAQGAPMPACVPGDAVLL